MTRLIQLGIPAWLILTMGSCLPLAGGCAASGANAAQQHNADLAKLQLLQQGNAKGHLVFQSGGKIGVGAENNFYLGLMDSNLSFTGEVDYSDASFPSMPGAQPFTPDPSIPAGVVGTGHP